MKKYMTAAIKFIIRALKTAAILSFAAVAFFVCFTIAYYIFMKPSKNKFDRLIEWKYFWEKNRNGECIIDLAEVIDIEWDSAEYYNEKYSSKDLTEILLFMHHGHVVYSAEWVPQEYENSPGGVIFVYDEEIPTFYPHNAKFKAYKDTVYDYEDKFILLKQIK